VGCTKTAVPIEMQFGMLNQVDSGSRVHFQAGGRRRRPNLGLVCISLLLAVFLVKDA